MTSNYHYLKQIFSSAHFLIGAMAWQLSNVTHEMGDLTSFKLAIS